MLSLRDLLCMMDVGHRKNIISSDILMTVSRRHLLRSCLHGWKVAA
jgi:hypothetical protein